MAGALLAIGAASVKAGVYTELGNTTFVRDKGKPVLATTTFPSTNPGATFTLNLYNGGLESGEQVSSAIIRLNGEQVFGTSDFNQMVDFLSAEVVLQAANVLEVELRGKPDSLATINIEGWDDDHPSIDAEISPPANEEGWHKVAATVSFRCSDPTSGIEFCSEPVVVATDGADQRIAGQAVDRAGNTSTLDLTVSLDSVAPTVTLKPDRDEDAPGWYNHDLEVAVICEDELSGIAGCSPKQYISTEGRSQLVTGSAVDMAGNALSTSAEISLDKTKPSLTSRYSRAANPNGWHNQPVGIDYSCTDALSGVAVCPGSIVIVTEGAGQQVTAEAIDHAGNAVKLSDHLNFDQTQPIITTLVSSAPDAEGIYREPVTITFSCSDELSGIEFCPEPVTVTKEGLKQLVQGTAIDVAGNRSQVPLEINILLNQPPAISSTPITTVSESELYEYSVLAEDPDTGDVLTYELTQYPEGMSIDVRTGIVSWQTNHHSAGEYQVAVRVTDTDGAFDSQVFQLIVVNVVQPPLIVSVEDQTLLAGSMFTSSLVATAGEGGNLVYGLLQGPEGFVVDTETGEMTWLPVAKDIEVHDITVFVAEDGAITKEYFKISVVGDIDTGGLEGTDFWLAFPHANDTNAIFISSDTAANGIIEQVGFGPEVQFSIPDGGGVWRHDLGMRSIIRREGIESKAIHVVTDAPVSVNYLSFSNHDADAVTVYPTDALGKEYRIVSYNQNVGTGFFVVATDDGTEVKIRPEKDYWKDGKKVAAGTEFAITLDRGQSYSQHGYYGLNELTATRIESDKPLAVFSHHTCVYIPSPEISPNWINSLMVAYKI
jgi:TusA-related sulfurtransferase